MAISLAVGAAGSLKKFGISKEMHDVPNKFTEQNYLFCCGVSTLYEV